MVSQKNKSLESALLAIKEDIIENIEKKNLALGIFLDLKKAFDSVQHEILLKKLPFYGIRGTAWSLLKSYLSSRTQYSVVNGYNSEIAAIEYGVPQGSIHKPILFLLYINDIVTIQGKAKLVLYADDTNVFFSGVDNDELFTCANNCLSGLNTWLPANKLQLNTAKTKYSRLAIIQTLIIHTFG